MGMLDPILLFGDHFKDGEVFTLQGAKVGDEISTEYGPTRPVLFKINGKVYSIIGTAIRGQVERMDASDREAMKSGQMRVKVVRMPGKKAGNSPAKVLVSHDWEPSPGVDTAGFDTPTTGDDDIPF